MISKKSQWHHWLSILRAWLSSFTFTICDTRHAGCTRLQWFNAATLYAGTCAGYGCTSGATSTTFGRGSTIWQFRFHREVALEVVYARRNTWKHNIFFDLFIFGPFLLPNIRVYIYTYIHVYKYYIHMMRFVTALWLAFVFKTRFPQLISGVNYKPIPW